MTSTPPQASAPAPAPTATSTLITAAQHVEIWKHLIEDVIRYKVDEDLYNVLHKNGVTDVIELMTEFAANEEDMAKWKYKRDAGSTTGVAGSTYNISKKNIADVLALQDYIYHVAAKLLLATPAQMNFAQLMSLNRQDFAIMRTDPQYKKNRTVTFQNAADSNLTTTNAGGNSAGSGGGGAASNGGNGMGGGSYNLSAAQLFRKSIKRDPSHFPELKHDNGYDSWKRGTQVNARVQDVEEVLDPTYIPSDPQEQEVFDLKQHYMYSIFEKNLLTNKGKAIVRKHQKDGNAQLVFKEVDEHYTKSINAQANSTELNHYIITTRIDDNKWNGTTYDYVMHWQEQVRLYHSLIPDASRYSEKMLLDLLHNAVSGHPELRTTYQLAQQSALVAGNPISYDDYCILLLGACTNYDNSIKKKGNRAPKEQRNIYLSHADYLSQADDSVSGITGDTGIEVYNIDTNPGTIEANFVRRGSSMTKQQWIRLDEKSQSIWDQLTPEAKSIILERPPPKPTGHLPSTSQRNAEYLKKQGERRRINLSETLEAHDETADGEAEQEDADYESSQQLTAFLSEKTDRLHPAHLQRLMSSKQPPNSKSNHVPNKKDIKVKTIEYMGHEYSINIVNLNYSVSNHVRRKDKALIDRGANGGVAGADVTVVNRHLARKVDITGVENHQIKDIYLGTVAGMTTSVHGPVIVFLHQQALLCKGSSILSSLQMEAAGSRVSDRSSKLEDNGQRIVKDGHIFPLSFENGLPRMKLRPVTDAELDDDSIPHCHLTDDIDWDPTIYDNDGIIEAFSDHPAQNDPLFNEFGDYRHTVIINSTLLTDDILDTHPFLEDHVISTDDIILEVFARETTTHPPDNDDADPDEPKQNDVDKDVADPNGEKQDDAPEARVLADTKIDFEALRPNFGWQPTDIVQKTFECTTQYGRLPMADRFQKHYRSPHPALNVHRRDEDVATDTVYSDTPAIDCGDTVAQFYCGRESLVCDIYGMKTDSQFVNTLQDNIRKRGAMNRLLSDRAQVEINGRVKDFLRLYCIGDWQSEPLQDHQKPSERRYQTVKRMANTIMSRAGSPAYTWLLALLYVCFVLNHSASAHLNYQAPLNVMTGTTIDCSPLLLFRWWELVEYKLDETDFPSDSSPGAIGHFVGFSENVGHRMTFKILTLDTLKVIHRSNVRSAEHDDTFNWKAIAALDGEDIPEIVKSIRDRLVPASNEGATEFKTHVPNGNPDDNSDEIKSPRSPTIDVQDLIGRTFLLDENKDGEIHRARIVEAITDQEEQNQQLPEYVKFKCSVNDDQYEEILSYNELMDYIEGQDQDDRVWKFRRIVSHEGPLTKRHQNWRGSKYNVMIEWENGEITREPLHNIAADDPVTCAIYARENDLLDLPGWKRFKRIAKRQKKMFRMANQAKLRSFRTAPKYMYGYEVPRDWKHAVQLDTRNGNKKWQESTALEFAQLEEYDTFIDIGFAKTPNGYKRIKVHLVYAVKHDGRHKARCVADGHLTDIPVDSVYSGVVSLRGIRMLIFLAELNGLETWGTDIGNAYLEATTSELLVITAGPEFGDLEGHTLIIFKALYGLRSSGLRWHLRFSAVLKKEGFQPCKMEPDLWLRAKDGVYEYVAVYVDDLAFAMRDPKSFTGLLTNRYQFKLKGTGPIEFHLGCDFVRDDDGILAMQPKKYIDRMVDSYVRLFGEKPKKRVRSPLEENDHPEIDDTEFLDADGIARYQSLVGSMQWAISLGRFDIATACMTLSSFRSCPRQGHLERAKRVVGYLANMPDAMIRFRTKIPDLSDLPGFEYNWDLSIYGDVKEEIPNDAPEPLGNAVQFIHYVDANLYHDMITGRSVTGILHFANQTPIDWFSKKQGKVETATYGSEFMAARTCVEQIIDLRLTFRYLGVPVQDKSYLFGDNEAVVNSAARIDSKLHKRHNALSYHRVREAIASNMMDFHHIPGKHNPADILSKHWAYGKIWDLLQPLMFWEGDTASIEDYRSKKKKLEDDKATVSTAPSTIKMDRS